jgi:hypothetical protein
LKRFELSRRLAPASQCSVRGWLRGGHHPAGKKLAELKREINLLKEGASTLSPALAHFLKDLEDLTAAAEENHNPIAFV